MGASEQVPPRRDPPDKPEPVRREELPGKLTTIAAMLTADYERLTGPRKPVLPGDTMLSYLREGVETAEKDIDEVQAIARACSRLLGQRPFRELDRLNASVLEAKEAVVTALLAFDAPERADPFGAQSRGYFGSAKQLNSLAGRCTALADRLSAVKNLPGEHSQ